MLGVGCVKYYSTYSSFSLLILLLPFYNLNPHAHRFRSSFSIFNHLLTIVPAHAALYYTRFNMRILNCTHNTTYSVIYVYVHVFAFFPSSTIFSIYDIFFLVRFLTRLFSSISFNGVASLFLQEEGTKPQSHTQKKTAYYTI